MPDKKQTSRKEQPKVASESNRDNPVSKKWWKYLLESLMLFIAVALGFLSDNLREQFVDRKKEKQYILSMLEDLKQDTLSIRQNIDFWQARIKGIDSLRHFLKPPLNPENGVTLYRLLWKMYDFTDLKYHDETIQQLKSGNFGLLKNQHVVTELVNYDLLIHNQYYYIEQSTRDQYIYLRHLQHELVDANNFTISSDWTFKPDLSFHFFIKNDADKIFNYTNELFNYKHFASVLIVNDKNLLQTASKLIDLIHKEYPKLVT